MTEEIISKSEDQSNCNAPLGTSTSGLKRKSPSGGLLQPGQSSSTTSTSPRTSTIEKLKLKNKKLKLKKKELEKSIKNVESLDKLSIFMLDSFENEEKSKKKLFSASRSFSQTDNSIYNDSISSHLYKIRNYSSSFSSSAPSPSLEDLPPSSLPPLLAFNWKKIILSEEFILNFKFQFHLPSSPSHTSAPVSIWYPFRSNSPPPSSNNPLLPFAFDISALIDSFKSVRAPSNPFLYLFVLTFPFLFLFRTLLAPFQTKPALLDFPEYSMMIPFMKKSNLSDPPSPLIYLLLLNLSNPSHSLLSNWRLYSPWYLFLLLPLLPPFLFLSFLFLSFLFLSFLFLPFLLLSLPLSRFKSRNDNNW